MTTYVCGELAYIDTSAPTQKEQQHQSTHSIRNRKNKTYRKQPILEYRPPQHQLLENPGNLPAILRVSRGILDKTRDRLRVRRDECVVAGDGVGFGAGWCGGGHCEGVVDEMDEGRNGRGERCPYFLFIP